MRRLIRQRLSPRETIAVLTSGTITVPGSGARTARGAPGAASDELATEEVPGRGAPLAARGAGEDVPFAGCSGPTLLLDGRAETSGAGSDGAGSARAVSGEIGSRVTFRITEIPIAREGETLRGPHRHLGYEECIYVLKGQGRMLTESGALEVKLGDVLLVPSEEKHVTRNTGSEPLVLLCFFPTPDIVGTTENFSDF